VLRSRLALALALSLAACRQAPEPAAQPSAEPAATTPAATLCARLCERSTECLDKMVINKNQAMEDLAKEQRAAAIKKCQDRCPKTDPEGPARVQMEAAVKCAEQKDCEMFRACLKDVAAK
jgi:hypothetical protein